jgi:alpha-mannosidase
MSEKKLHLIGNAHIDPVWLWTWQEGFHEVHATFKSALDRMNEFDDFIFSTSSAAFFEWIEQVDPQMFEQICQRVQEGRWELTGGWWIEPDCNIPSGESFARQGLYGQRFFRQKFGRMARTGFNIDSFGHSGNLPQILKKSGIDYYVFLRPSPHEKGLPGRLFWWEANDGSRVLAFRIPYEYCYNRPDMDVHIRRVAAELKEPFDELMCFYGVGNHGGGPTIAHLKLIHELQQSGEYPTLEFSSPERYFTAVEGQGLPIPVVHDELQHHASGCYASHSGIKRWNRRAEHALIAAEKLSAAAGVWAGLAYPREFERAWKNVLFNQFHDILAGSSIEAAYDDARLAFDEALNIAARSQNLAMQALAWKIIIPQEDGMFPIVVFNPHAWAARMNVEIEMGGWPRDDFALLDPQDQPVAFQLVQSAATANGRYRMCFAADLPALGYKVYRFAPRPELTPVFPVVSASDMVLENARFRLEINPASGCIASLYDKRGQCEVFLGDAARPVVIEDTSDTWSHNVFIFNQVVGQMKLERIRLMEAGPVKAVIRVDYSYGKSHLAQDFILYQQIERVDVKVGVDWHELFKMLKLRFPLNMNNMKILSETAYGSIERRANGEEEPGQGWLDVTGVARDSGQVFGLSLLNDSKYSYDVNIRDIGLTVLRSPIYAHHIPKEPDAERSYHFIDQGYQEFTYSLLPHTGVFEQSGAVRQSWEINQPASALNSTFHPGSLPQEASFISVNRENILASVLKLAEDGQGWILRLYETAGQRTRALIDLPALNRRFAAAFLPGEIKTFYLPVDISAPVIETNLLEDPIREVEPEAVVNLQPPQITAPGEQESQNGGSKN